MKILNFPDCMSVYVTTNIYPDRKSCYMSRICIDINSQCCRCTTKSSWSDSQSINFLQHFFTLSS